MMQKKTARRTPRGAGRTVAATVLCMAVAEWAGFSGAAGETFSETFDDRTTGVLHAQNDWRSHRQNSAQVQTSRVYAGPKAGMVSTNATVWRDFTNATATNVWIDFYARVPYPGDATEPSLAGSVAAAFFITDTGKIRAISNETWVTLNHTVLADTWQRFSVNLDYGARTWGLYVAGSTPNELATTVATNLAFSSASTNTYFRRFRVKN